MNKFYYKKAESLDKTPIILRMERRRTINTNEAAMQDEKRKMFARAASISSLDHITGVPSVPRTRSRDLAKSLSEDVLSRGQSKGPKVITEAELSSSWLYKAMQESVNARFKSPNKPSFPQIKEDLEPIKIQDPNMKPIPVIAKSSRRKTTCCCRCAKVAAITIITLGVMAAIAGIIYMEVFANKDLTSHETSETPIDLSKLNFDSRESREEMIKHDLKNEEELETIQNSYRSSAGRKSTKSPLTEIYDQKKMKAHIEIIEKPNAMELDQYLSNPKTKVKFQDGETVIYEVKSSAHENSNDDFKDGSLVNFNRIEKDSLSDNNEFYVIKDETLDDSETFQDSRFGKLNEHFDISTKGNFDADIKEFTFRTNQGKYVAAETGSDKLERKKITEKLVSDISPVKVEESEGIMDSGIAFKITPNANKNVFRGWDRIGMIDSTTESSFKSEMENKAKILPSVESLDQFNKEILSQTLRDQYEREISLISNLDQYGRELVQPVPNVEQEQETKKNPSVQYIDQDDHKRSDHDVELMVEVIEDPEDETTDYLISNRNEDIFPPENYATKTENEPFHSLEKTGMIDPIKESSADEPELEFHKAESTQSVKNVENMPPVNQDKNESSVIEPKKPMDIKFSLANAMKHLQGLDVNNKILSARMKTTKSKSEKSKQQKLNFNPRREEYDAKERMKYLQKVRLMLYEHLQ